ncbi:MAG: alpha-galactosidase [Treponema sp.]|nr:alpha-galactosidase [Treponema sp.]
MLNASFFYDKAVQIRLTDGSQANAADFNIVNKWNGEKLRVSIKNISGTPSRIREIVLFAGRAEIPAETEFYGEGYHMLAQYRGNMNETEVIGAYGSDREFFHLPDNPYDGDLNIVYYLLRLTLGGAHSLLAFASCNKFLGKFRFKQNYLEIVMDTENLILNPGQSWEMEELAVFSGSNCADLFDKLAAAINQNHPPLKPVTKEIPTGWCSYYCVGRMEPSELYKNAEAMAERIPELEMIQIDAGLNTCDGDWMDWRFDDDLSVACRKVREAGVKAGGYCSPFIVDFQSKLFVEHRDWLVRDEDGNPTNRLCHKKDWCILDGTHPGARSYLKKIMRYMHDDCGLRYFKLDFLSYGALPAGRRYDETKTSVEAFRMGMIAMLEEIADDSFVLACNAPFWPCLGLAHANRTTNDIFRDWKHAGGNALEQFYRNWMHQKLWINDPDCVVLEKLDIIRLRDGLPSKRPCTLTDDEFDFHKAFIIACGGMVLSGDLLYEISQQNINILKKMMGAMGEAAVFDSDKFNIGRFKKKNLICLFNWDDSVKTFTVPLNRQGHITVSDFWTEEKLGVFENSIEINMPAHSGKVIRLESAKKFT